MAKVYQVFIGCPFLSQIRNSYDKLRADIEATTPFHVVMADTTAVKSTDYLLEHITGLIKDSAGCIFDVTGGNPNVSLEIGIAHALPADFLIALKTRKPRNQTYAQKSLEREGERRPIVSDLQGRNRVEYKSYPTLRDQVMKRYIVDLPYMRRWNRFSRNHSSYIEYALKIFDEIRVSQRTVVPRVTAMLDGSGIAPSDLLKALNQEKLITIKQGRGGGIYYPSK